MTKCAIRTKEVLTFTKLAVGLDFRMQGSSRRSVLYRKVSTTQVAAVDPTTGRAHQPYYTWSSEDRNALLLPI